MSKFSRQERNEVYEKALQLWGCKEQATVAIEEMSEVIKEITKMLRGELDREHMAEEIADATIMLEQLRQMLNINDSVESWMDYKVAALKRKVEKCG
jgi:NTP pyrophosphatase (non-canonical NTP hydrolase)